MKAKFHTAIIFFVGFMMIGNAQDQNAECMTNLSIFVEHGKVKNYDAAYEPWKMVYDNCPKINLAVYIVGEKILKDKHKKSSGAEKDGFATDYLTLLDNRLLHFPAKTKKADMIIKKVLFKYDNKSISNDDVYAQLSEGFTTDYANFKNPKALYLYFSSLVDLHDEGKKELQEVFDIYDNVTEKIEEENIKLTDIISKLLPKEEAGTLTSKEKKRLKSATTNSKSYGKIASSIDSKLGKLADCTNLIPLYQKNFESKKNDITWVKRAVSRMFNKDCTDDPLFRQMVEVQAGLDPSADVYVYLGTLKQKSGNTSDAVADFDKALGLETDSRKKSNIAYKVATIYRRGSKSTARKYAQKAIDANPSNGKAYLLIASLYASSANDCGSTTFEKLAMYWKAADMARKASRVDPSLSSRANKSVKSYMAKAPTKSMIFDQGMAGKTVTFNCWVGGSVKVPNL